ncbi:VanZ family protein [uncultured Clostridium sp.]|uniref:VanZ family protein n=1 Tax=uncultured Clostridium sp. TaxID=59620 RepID=UPI002615BAD6|nr:VanZ family protein [uncultured Clostridium sp.]
MRIYNELILIMGMVGVAFIWGKAILKVRNGEKISKTREFIKSMFLIYFVSVLWLTFGFKYGFSLEFYMNLNPFVESIKMLQVNTQNGLYQIIGNLIMLVPLGVFLPLLYKSCRKAYITTFIGFLFSFFIEISQGILGRTADIDDLIFNTVGVIIGYFTYKLLSKITKKIGNDMLENMVLEKGIRKRVVPIFVLFFVIIYMTGINDIYSLIKTNGVEVASIPYKIEDDGYKIVKQNKDEYGVERFLAVNEEGNLKLGAYDARDKYLYGLGKKKYTFTFDESILTENIGEISNVYKDGENFIKYETSYNDKYDKIKSVLLYGKVKKGDTIKLKSKYGEFEYKAKEEYIMEDVDVEHLNIDSLAWFEISVK